MPCNRPTASPTVATAPHLAEAALVNVPGGEKVALQVVVLEDTTGPSINANGVLRVARDGVAIRLHVAITHHRQSAVGMPRYVIVFQRDDAAPANEDAPAVAIMDAVLA